MNPEWSDLVAAADPLQILVVDGTPTSDRIDIHAWDDDVASWLAAAHHVGVRMVYAERVTAADFVRGLQHRLNEARPLLHTDALEARVDALDLALAGAAGDRTTIVGWSGEWRHGGVAHGFDAVEPSDRLQQLASEVDDVIDAVPTNAERVRINRLDSEEHRAAFRRDRDALFDDLANALSTHPEFATCTNEAQRRNLFRRIVKERDVDTIGLSRDEIVEEAKRIRRDAGE